METVVRTHRTRDAKAIRFKPNRKYQQGYGPAGTAQGLEFKPHGFWYSVDGHWEEWCASTMPHWLGRYEYEVDIGTSNILFINSYAALVRFVKQYGVDKYPTIPGMRMITPDWNRVVLEYDGIEIAPYIWQARHDMLWYYSWDCASGCVWNCKNLKVTLVKDHGALKNPDHLAVIGVSP